LSDDFDVETCCGAMMMIHKWIQTSKGIWNNFMQCLRVTSFQSLITLRLWQMEVLKDLL
jgi:hypothetical protein